VLFSVVLNYCLNYVEILPANLIRSNHKCSAELAELYNLESKCTVIWMTGTENVRRLKSNYQHKYNLHIWVISFADI